MKLITTLFIFLFFIPSLNFAQGIVISKEQPQFWEYKGKTVLLLGGSLEDNLFQIENLEEQLDLLKASEGNYVRCTMSSRDEGNVWPFLQQDDGMCMTSTNGMRNTGTVLRTSCSKLRKEILLFRLKSGLPSTFAAVLGGQSFQSEEQ